MNYNRDAAVGYAVQFTDKYAGYTKYNRDGFGHIETNGSGNSGDCANYVSQCLWAGGLPMTTAWYNNTPYSNPGIGNTTWNGTNSLRLFLINRGWASHISSKYSLKKGDIVYTYSSAAGYKHVVMVSRDVGSDGKIYVCGHTANQRDKLRVTPSGCSDYYLHINDSISTIGTDRFHVGYNAEDDFNTAMQDYGPDTLQLGETSTYISNLQRRLQYLGYYSGSINGSFDSATETAVQNFQTAMNLTADGLPGWKTKNKLYHPST